MLSILNFLKIKKIPTLFWSSPKTFTYQPPIVSVAVLLIGTTLFGLGETLLISAGIGVSPWTVFAQGISNVTGHSIGFSTFLVSFFVLLLWIPLKQVPGVGTIVNIFIIALVLDYALPFMPTFETFYFKLLGAIAGVLLTGLGGAVYLIANLGPGPRDGLMTGFQSITNLPMAFIRNSIELTVVLIGWLLGGVVGIGTILFALGIGPAISASLFSLEKLFNGINSRK